MRLSEKESAEGRTATDLLEKLYEMLSYAYIWRGGEKRGKTKGSFNPVI